jgi:hypothetical protein
MKRAGILATDQKKHHPIGLPAASGFTIAGIGETHAILHNYTMLPTFGRNFSFPFRHCRQALMLPLGQPRLAGTRRHEKLARRCIASPDLRDIGDDRPKLPAHGKATQRTPKMGLAEVVDDHPKLTDAGYSRIQ